MPNELPPSVKKELDAFVEGEADDVIRGGYSYGYWKAVAELANSTPAQAYVAKEMLKVHVKSMAKGENDAKEEFKKK